MSREFDEKRDSIRVDVDTEVRINIDGQEEQLGRVKNLSGRGMMFIIETELEKESTAEVYINPEIATTSSLHARVRIVRVVKQRRGTGYEIGAVIQEMLN